MQLEQGEKSILAYFPSSDLAQEASKELIDIGYNTVQVDRISAFGANTDPATNSAIAGNALSSTGLTFFSSETGDLSTDERILRGSDPSNSGYGNKDYGITVVTSDGSAEQAEKILTKHGARF